MEKNLYSSITTNLLEQEDLCEMANLPASKTHIKFTIWSDGAGKYRERKDYGPRIKVGLRDEFLISLSLDEDLRVLYRSKNYKPSYDKYLNEARDYIRRNLDLFQKHYNSHSDEYDDSDLRDDLAERGDFTNKKNK